MITAFAFLIAGRNQINPADQQWIGHSLYVKKGKLNDSAFELWWHPPDIPFVAPKADTYHMKRLFLWAPRRMWMIDLKCPLCCTRSLW